MGLNVMELIFTGVGHCSKTSHPTLNKVVG